jgi:ABC-type sugar transport system ATPase subunit
VRALDRVDLACRPGRVHALLGENGAGKSTLVGILTGNQQPDAGSLSVDGRPVAFNGPRDALKVGVHAVYQELTVLPAMSVADNVMLGQEWSRRGVLRRRDQEARIRPVLEEVGLDGVDPGLLAGELSLANRQLVEIARALVRQSRVVILDEPSAVLSGDKLGALHAVVRKLAARGSAVLYITHLLQEVEQLADDVTVLRDGATVSTGLASEYPVDRIVREMVGREVASAFGQKSAPGTREVLEVTGLVPRTSSPPPPVDLTVRAGEIVGLAGLVGSGRSRLLRAMAGVRPIVSGRVLVDGVSVSGSLHRAIGAGVVLVPEERKSDGLVLDLSVAANTSLTDLPAVQAFGFLSGAKEGAAFDAERSRLGIRASGPNQVTSQLSGGNQQKVVIGKWLRRSPKVLLLDEPTRGVDVGAKAEIYKIINQLALSGVAVVMASSDMIEVLGLSHRVLVFHRGAVAGELVGRDINEEAIMHLAVGSEPAR